MHCGFSPSYLGIQGSSSTAAPRARPWDHDHGRNPTWVRTAAVAAKQGRVGPGVGNKACEWLQGRTRRRERKGSDSIGTCGWGGGSTRLKGSIQGLLERLDQTTNLSAAPLRERVFNHPSSSSCWTLTCLCEGLRHFIIELHFSFR